MYLRKKRKTKTKHTQSSCILRALSTNKDMECARHTEEDNTKYVNVDK